MLFISISSKSYINMEKEWLVIGWMWWQARAGGKKGRGMDGTQEEERRRRERIVCGEGSRAHTHTHIRPRPTKPCT
jgi:hypothetical protein